MANEKDVGPALFVKLLKGLPSEEQLPEVRSYLSSIEDLRRRQAVEQYVLAALQGQADLPETVVVFVHGILTAAEWQQRLADHLVREADIEAVPVGVQPVDVLTFLCPFFGRKYLANVVAKKLKAVHDIYPNAEVSVVAHSFGTYLVTKALSDNPEIRFQRLILCGSIVEMYFDWSKVRSRIAARGVVNDVGTKDAWPVMAFLGSFGYGPSGSVGFKDPNVRDRYFPFGHSGFFTEDHLRDYWLPFLTEGRVVPSPHTSTRGTPPWWATHLPTWPAKCILWAIFWGLGWLGWRVIRWCFLS